METNYSSPSYGAAPSGAEAAGAPPAHAAATTGPRATAGSRIEEFRSEIAGMDLKAPADASEKNYFLAGIILMVAGAVVILLGYWGASGTALVNEQIPYLISGGVLGLGLMVVGAAMFVRFSLSRYLRFWLIREIYEQRAQTDRVVESLDSVEALLRAATRPRSQQ